MRTIKQNNYFTKYFRENGFEYALKALELINTYHKGIRKDGSEERGHMFEVLGFAIANFENRLKPKDLEHLIVVSALHDLVEDYSDEISFKDLKMIFPKDMVRSIKKVTKWSTFTKCDKDYLHYHSRISKDLYSTIVKATDRIHNLNSCTAVFTPSKKKLYIDETRSYIIPNLKLLRRKHKDLYTPITFLIYNLKNQINQLEYVIHLEENICNK